VGRNILQQGGSAVDAAVAVGFALAVVHPEAGNIGGGGFMIIRPRNGKVQALDYRETAPGQATRDMYRSAGEDGSVTGHLSAGVPGAVAGLTEAHRRYGRLPLAAVIQPAIRLALEGFTVDDYRSRSIGEDSARLVRFPASRTTFLPADRPPQPGSTFRQPELGATLEAIRDSGAAGFYRGRVAELLVAEMKRGGGIISLKDLADYRAVWRDPITISYRGYTIYSMPPASSGGVTMGEILNIMEGFSPLPRFGSASLIHREAEAMRRAFTDRNTYLGDPAFVRNPIDRLLSKQYAADLRRQIGERASPTPVFEPTPAAGSSTTHYSVVDAEGNAVSCTTTLNNSYGSAVTVTGAGFLLNDEMDDFASKQGVPNMYGLIQGPANSIAPYKRPLSAMTPTIVTRNGRLRYVMGSPGGSTIITTVANDIISVIDNHLNIQQAADAPRFHHQYLPDRLDVEKKFSHSVAAQLRAMGYTVYRHAVADEHNPGVWGDSELIALDPRTHTLLGGHDNRRDYGKAEGY